MRRLAFSLIGITLFALGVAAAALSAALHFADHAPDVMAAVGLGLAMLGALSYAAAWFMPVFTYPHYPAKGRRLAKAALPSFLRGFVIGSVDIPAVGAHRNRHA